MPAAGVGVCWRRSLLVFVFNVHFVFLAIDGMALVLMLALALTMVKVMMMTMATVIAINGSLLLLSCLLLVLPSS